MSGLFRWLSGFICLWPEWVIAAASYVFGALWFHLVRYRRDVMLQNMAQAFGEMTEGQRRSLCKEACIHLARTLLEFLRLPRYHRLGLPRRVRIEGLEHYEAAKAQGRGVLFLGGHLGSFELGAAAVATRLADDPIHFVVKPFSPGFDAFVTRLRLMSNLRLLPAKESARRVFTALRRNEAVVLVLDQNATHRIGVFVDFFGRSACTMTSAALFADSKKAPVLGTASWREPDGTHVLRIYPPIPLEAQPTRDETTRHMTQRYTRFIEDRIREHPAQWLWSHKRWKTRPEG